MGRFSHHAKMSEAMREVGKRRAVYPKLVASGKLDHGKSLELIDIMDEIAADYEAAYKRKAGSGSDKLAFTIRVLKQIVETSGGVGVAFQIATAALKDLDK